MAKLRGTISNKNTINAHMSKGVKGKSAYEVWLDLGNVGNEQDFIDSIGSEGGGTTNYNLLRNKPMIENIELVDNKTFEELGLIQVSEQEIRNLF